MQTIGLWTVIGIIGYVVAVLCLFAWQRARQKQFLAEQQYRLAREQADQIPGLQKRIEDLAGKAGLAERLPGVEQARDAAEQRAGQAERALAALKAQREVEASAHQEKLDSLIRLRADLEKDFRALAGQALTDSQKSFLDLAGETLRQHKEQVQAQAKVSGATLEAIVKPLADNLVRYQGALTELEKNVAQSRGANEQQLKDVASAIEATRSETSKLINAFRAAPATRGAWGEITLRRVMELSQMVEHCDFATQEGLERNALRPDVIIRMPGNRNLVVDAKASMSAYLDAVDATEPLERERHLQRHLQQVKDKVAQLSSKAYQDALDSTPDFVVMFIPGDNLYMAAAERDPDLFEDASAKGVIITTPATLMALARAVAFGWRQESIAEDARKVHALGKDLYVRMSTMAGHVQKCGSGLESAVMNFNALVGSLERTVMPAARKFNEMKVEGTAQPLLELEPVETSVRVLDQRRDFKHVGHQDPGDAGNPDHDQ